jgi:hypothetical protein
VQRFCWGGSTCEEDINFDTFITTINNSCIKEYQDLKSENSDKNVNCPCWTIDKRYCYHVPCLDR